jgi:hypothetical protein
MRPTVEIWVDNTAKLRLQALASALRAAGANQLMKPRQQHREATAAGIGPGTTAMYMQRTTSGAAGNGLYTTMKYMRGASGIGMGTTIKHLRPTTSDAGNGLGATIKYLLRTTSAAANNCLSTTIIPPCILILQRPLKLTQSPTPGRVPRSVCVWGPSLLAVIIVFRH